MYNIYIIEGERRCLGGTKDLQDDIIREDTIILKFKLKLLTTA